MNIKPWIWQTVLPLLLASSTTAANDVTCTTSEVNLLQNPSFETGSIAGWKSVDDSMSLVSGTTAADGNCHLERSSRFKGPLSGVYQPVSGLVKGSTYTVSAQWRIQKPVDNGRASCNLAFYMVGKRSTSYVGGYENLRATPENTAWTTVEAQFTAKSSSETLYVYLFCPAVRRQQAKADLDNIKILNGQTTTSCTTLTASPTSFSPVISPSALPPVDSPSGSSIIISPISSNKPSSPLASGVPSTSATSAHPGSSQVLSSIPPVHVTSSSANTSPSITTSSSLIRVTITSRPPPSSRPTLHPIGSSSVPVVSSSAIIPAESGSATVTTTSPSDVETPGPSSGPGAPPGSGGSGGGTGSGSGAGSDNSSGGESGNSSGGGDSGSGNGNPGTGNGGSGTGDSGNGNGESGAGGSESGSSDGGMGSGHGGSGSGGGSENGGASPSGGIITTPSPTAPQLTTSTVFTTRTSTITACAATVTNCPARSTYVTTETILVSTTICPVEAITTTNPGGAIITGSPAAPGNTGDHQYTTETILKTRTVTVTACPSSVTNCPARDKTTSIATETLVAGTTVYEVVPTATGLIQTGSSENPASGHGSNGNAPGPKVTDIATANPNKPPVYVTSTRVVTVLACPVQKETLA